MMVLRKKQSGIFKLLLPFLYVCLLMSACSEPNNSKSDPAGNTIMSSQADLEAPPAQENPWESVDMDTLTKMGVIIFKDPDSEYFSSMEVTRADVIYLAITAARVPIIRYDERFYDVPQNAWYADAVCTAAENGFIADMIENNSFMPEKLVTRQEFAELVATMAEFLYGSIEAGTKEVQINDMNKVSQNFKAYVKYAVEIGVLGLDNSMKFNPENTVKGYEMSKAIRNLAICSSSNIIDILGLVRDAFDRGESAVKIPAGKYNITAGPDGAHLLFQNLVRDENNPFIIDADDVYIECQDNSKTAVQFSNCKNIVFKGANIGYSEPAMTQGEVTAILDEGHTVEVLLDAGYPGIDSQTPTAYVYDKDTLKMKNDCPDMYSISCENLGSHMYHIKYDYDVRMKNVAVSDILGFRRNGSFNTQLLNCEKVTIKDCTITDGMFALHENGGNGGNVYDGVTVTFREKPEGAVRDRVLSTFADALHSDNMRNGPVVMNCRFEGMGDDCFNVHGSYAMLMEKTGNCEYIIGTVGMPIFDREGDRVRINDINGNLLGETKIKKVIQTEIVGYKIPGGIDEVHRINERFTPSRFQKIKTEEDLDLPFGAMLSNPDMGGKGFKIINNTFGPNRARGLLIKADDGIIEGNTFIGQSIHSILVAPEFYWNESGYVRNLVIKNNTFKDSGFISGYQPTLLISGEGGKDGGISHMNILVENNTFEGNYGDSLSAEYVDGFVVSNNHFLSRNEVAQKTRNGFAHIRIENSRNVEIYGNEFEDGGVMFVNGGNTEFTRLDNK